MGRRYRVVAKVVELRAQPGKEPCPYMAVGDEFDLSTPEGRGNLCEWAFHSIFAQAAVLEFGGSFPWEPDPDKALAACPDPHRIAVFELKRDGERPWGASSSKESG